MQNLNSDIECIYSGRDIHRNGTKYCIDCGRCLKNYCTNKECKHYLEQLRKPGGIRYCPYCGSKTAHSDILNSRNPLKVR